MLLDSNIIIYAAQPEHAAMVTHSIEDFRWIDEIKLLDPLTENA